MQVRKTTESARQRSTTARMLGRPRLVEPLAGATMRRFGAALGRPERGRRACRVSICESCTATGPSRPTIVHGWPGLDEGLFGHLACLPLSLSACPACASRTAWFARRYKLGVSGSAWSSIASWARRPGDELRPLTEVAPDSRRGPCRAWPTMMFGFAAVRTRADEARTPGGARLRRAVIRVGQCGLSSASRATRRPSSTAIAFEAA